MKRLSILCLALLIASSLSSCSFLKFILEGKSYQTVSMECGNEDISFNVPKEWPSDLMLLSKQFWYVSPQFFVIQVYHEKTKSLYEIGVFKGCKVVTLLRWNPEQPLDKWDWYILVNKIPVKMNKTKVYELLDRLHKEANEVVI